MKKKLTGIFVLAMLLCMAAAPAVPNAGAASAMRELVEDSMINQAVKRGTLRVGLSTFVPWAMPDKNGELIGFEVDVAKRVADDLGLKLELVPTEWSGIIPALLAGKFDVIIGSMSIRMDRNLKINFTEPYDFSGMDLLANRAKADGFSKLEHFNKPEVIIALRTGASSEPALKKYLPKAQRRYFDDEAQAVQEVILGRAHAMASSIPLPAFQALKHPDKLFTPLKEPFTRESVAMAIRKGDPDSLNVLNTWIRIATDDGWLKERHRYWFESTEWENLLK